MKQVYKKAASILLSLSILGTQSGCGIHSESKLPPKWWQDTLVYEIYPNSFKDSNNDGYGDLQGIISELDYLQDLGVGSIWLTPVYASPMKDNGYDVASFYDINPRYGTMEDMDELIEEAAKRDILIVMDLAFNHTSDECEWFKESASDKTNDKSDWYIWADPKEDGSAPSNLRGIFGGSAWTYCESRNQYYLHTFADFQPDLNWENKDVRKALCDVANFWADKGVGGFRVDAVTYIKKPSNLSDGPIDGPDNMSGIHNMTANTPGILDFLHEFKDNVQKGRNIFMVGEANGVPNSEMESWVGKDGVFDMIFSFDHVNIQFQDGEVWSKTRSWKLADLKNVITKQQLSIGDGWGPVFFENHDQPRCVDHFIPGCSDYSMGSKLIGMMMMTLKGTPFIYEGQEIGMSNINWTDINMYNDISSHNQYEMALANGLSPEEAIKCVISYSRDNARTPMQWNNKINAGFTEATPWLSVNSNYQDINVENQKNDVDSVLSWYKKLKDFRTDHKVLVNGSYTEILEDNENVFAYIREDNSEKLLVLLNFTDSTAVLDLSDLGTEDILISSVNEPKLGELKPYEATIISLSQK